MKSKSTPASHFKRAPTEKQLQAMCRRVEASLLGLGATPAEVALLRAAGRDPFAAAMTIAAIQIRKEEGGGQA